MGTIIGDYIGTTIGILKGSFKGSLRVPFKGSLRAPSFKGSIPPFPSKHQGGVEGLGFGVALKGWGLGFRGFEFLLVRAAWLRFAVGVKFISAGAWGLQFGVSLLLLLYLAAVGGLGYGIVRALSLGVGSGNDPYNLKAFNTRPPKLRTLRRKALGPNKRSPKTPSCSRRVKGLALLWKSSKSAPFQSLNIPPKPCSSYSGTPSMSGYRTCGFQGSRFNIPSFGLWVGGE